MNKLLSALLFFWVCASYGQKVEFPKHPKLSALFKKSIENQKTDFYRLFGADSAEIRSQRAELILERIDNSKEYWYLFEAEYWIAFNYDKIIPDLIMRITNKNEVGLVNSADLIIWERIESQHMEFYGHGGISLDDLFTVAGRANRLLTVITGEDFGHVSMYSTPQELKDLQSKWLKWLSDL